MENADQTGRTAEVFRTFLRLGVSSFGGPIAHLGYFRKEIVERRGWVSESQFSQLLAVCQFLPGPASSQLGFSLGLLRAGWGGAIAAFLAFTLPSALLLVGFAYVLPLLSSEVGSVAIHGLKLVACAVVADAVLGMSNKLCPDNRRRGIAIIAASIVLVVDAAWAQILVVASGALAGVLLCSQSAEESVDSIKVGYGRKSGLALLCVFVLILSLFVLPSEGSGLYETARAFYRAGALVFGGGHVVLPILEESVVASGWVSSENFLAGYGAAQAVPGPMFALSAYLGAIIPTGHAPWLGASIALVFMFLPGFLLVAAILPLWQSVSHISMARQAIAGVNAAVVGVLGAALYNPVFTSGVTSVVDMAIVLIAFGMLVLWNRSPLLVVAWCLVASLASALILNV